MSREAASEPRRRRAGPAGRRAPPGAGRRGDRAGRAAGRPRAGRALARVRRFAPARRADRRGDAAGGRARARRRLPRARPRPSSGSPTPDLAAALARGSRCPPAADPVDVAVARLPGCAPDGWQADPRRRPAAGARARGGKPAPRPRTPASWPGCGRSCADGAARRRAARRGPSSACGRAGRRAGGGAPRAAPAPLGRRPGPGAGQGGRAGRAGADRRGRPAGPSRRSGRAARAEAELGRATRTRWRRCAGPTARVARWPGRARGCCWTPWSTPPSGCAASSGCRPADVLPADLVRRGATRALGRRRRRPRGPARTTTRPG